VLPDAAPLCGLTPDFVSFLNYNGYRDFYFNRTDMPCGSYGGFTNSSKLNNTPIIFIHDNEDVAYGRGVIDGFKSWQTGFRYLAEFLMRYKNYSSA